MSNPSGVLFQNPIVKPLSSNGTFMSACTATFYLTGTTTFATVYADGALTTPLANPLASDATGTFSAVYLNPATIYRVQIKTAAGALISDTDPYVPLGLASLSQTILGNILYPETTAESTAGATPVNTWYVGGDSRRYNLDATGGSDVTTALQHVLDSAGLAASNGDVHEIVLQPGTYKVKRLYLNYSNVWLRIMPGATIVQTQVGITNQNSTGQTPAYAVIHINPLSYLCNPQSAVTAITNVRVYGGGTVQGPYSSNPGYQQFALGIVSNDCHKCWVTDLFVQGMGGESILMNGSAWNTCTDLRILGNEVINGGEVGINNARSFLELHNYIHDTWVQNGLSGTGDIGLICYNRIRNMPGNGMSTGGSGAKDTNVCSNIILGYNIIENTNVSSGSLGGYAIFLTDDGATTTPKIGIKVIGNICNLNNSGQGAVIGADFALATGLVDIENNMVIAGTSSLGSTAGIAIVTGAARYNLRNNTFEVGNGNMAVCMDILGGTPVVNLWSFDNKDVVTDIGHPTLFAVIDCQRVLTPTLTLTGCTTSPTQAPVCVKRNKSYTMALAAMTATSNAGTCTLTGLPAELTPIRNQYFVVPVEDNGTTGVGLLEVTTAGSVTLFKDITSAAFTSSGVKGLPDPLSVTVILD